MPRVSRRLDYMDATVSRAPVGSGKPKKGAAHRATSGPPCRLSTTKTLRIRSRCECRAFLRQDATYPLQMWMHSPGTARWLRIRGSRGCPWPIGAIHGTFPNRGRCRGRSVRGVSTVPVPQLSPRREPLLHGFGRVAAFL